MKTIHCDDDYQMRREKRNDVSAVSLQYNIDGLLKLYCMV